MTGPLIEPLADNLLNLPPRANEILVLIAEQGLSNKEIGHQLGLAEITVKMHVKNIMRHLEAHNRVHCASIYWKARLDQKLNQGQLNSLSVADPVVGASA